MARATSLPAIASGEGGLNRYLQEIRQELLSGVTDRVQFNLLRERLEAFPDVPIHTGDYERAAACFNECRMRGIQGSNTDYLICALALRLDVPVFSMDRDFGRYAHVLGVRLHAVEA